MVRKDRWLEEGGNKLLQIWFTKDDSNKNVQFWIKLSPFGGHKTI